MANKKKNRTPPPVVSKNGWTKFWTDCVYFFEGYHGTIEVEEVEKNHLRITRLKDGNQMDFFPNTRKACWLGFKDPITFFIPDPEAYLYRMFIQS